MPPSFDGDHLQELLAGVYVPSTPCVLLEKECLEEIGGFRTDLPCYQDWELWIRLAEKYQFAYLNEVLLTMHLHGNDRISSDHSKRSISYPIIYEAHKDLYYKDFKANALFLRRYANHCLEIGLTRKAKILFTKSLIFYPFEPKQYLIYAFIMTNRWGGNVGQKATK